MNIGIVILLAAAILVYLGLARGPNWSPKRPGCFIIFIGHNNWWFLAGHSTWRQTPASVVELFRLFWWAICG